MVYLNINLLQLAYFFCIFHFDRVTGIVTEPPSSPHYRNKTTKVNSNSD